MSLLDRLTQDPTAVDDYRNSRPQHDNREHPTDPTRAAVCERDDRDNRTWWK